MAMPRGSEAEWKERLDDFTASYMLHTQQRLQREMTERLYGFYGPESTGFQRMTQPRHPKDMLLESFRGMQPYKKTPRHEDASFDVCYAMEMGHIFCDREGFSIARREDARYYNMCISSMEMKEWKNEVLDMCGRGAADEFANVLLEITRDGVKCPSDYAKQIDPDSIVGDIDGLYCVPTVIQVRLYGCGKTFEYRTEQIMKLEHAWNEYLHNKMLPIRVSMNYGRNE